jgi:hypothetical protein
MNEFEETDKTIMGSLLEFEPSSEWRKQLDRELQAISLVVALPEIEPPASWRASLDERIAALAHEAVPLAGQLPDIHPTARWRGDLDAKLVALHSERKQSLIARLLRRLPEDSPNLIWRSQLNERVRVLAKPRKARPFANVFKPTAAVGLAGILMAVVIFQMRPMPVASVSAEPNVVDWMLETHEQSVAYGDLGVTQPAEYSGVAFIEEPADLSLGGI